MHRQFALSLLTVCCLGLVLSFGGIPSSASPLDQTATANATVSPDCQPASVIGHANALKSTGDIERDLTTLQNLAAEVSAQTIACHGLTFKGKGSLLSDPFNVAKGTYRVKLDWPSKTAFTGRLKQIDDSSCDVLVDYDPQGSSNLTERLDSLGCRATLQVNTFEDTNTEWVITLEPLK